MVKRIFVVVFCSIIFPVFALASDTYIYKDKCPSPSGGQMVIDKWNFYECECTSYVAHKLNEAGIAFHNHYNDVHWGDASKWKNAAQSANVTRTSSPQPGDVAWFSGHVAYVESVSGSNITISEYNNDPYVHGMRPLSISDVGTFIRFKASNSSPQPTTTSNNLTPFRMVSDTGLYGNTISIYWSPATVSCVNADMWCYGTCSLNHTNAVCYDAYNKLKNAHTFKYILSVWNDTFFGNDSISNSGNQCTP